MPDCPEPHCTRPENHPGDHYCATCHNHWPAREPAVPR